MKNISKNILEEYDSCKALYTGFTERIKNLVIDLLRNEEIKSHQITFRVKERDKLEGKILKKDQKYSKLSDITDIAGIRIITYFEDEVDKIANIIKTEFDIDLTNSIDKRQLEADRFGYRSLHYVAAINKHRIRLSEYKKYEGLKIEFQIRTILQHSWAEIEHDIGYKGDIAIPQFAKRTFYRVAALLETADLEFVKLKDLLKEYESKVEEEIKDAPETVLLDKASLQSYVNTSSIIAKTDKLFSEFAKVPIIDDPNDISNDLLNRINGIGIKTIKELEQFLIRNQAKLFEYFKKSIAQMNDKTKISGMSKGIILYSIDKV